MSGQTDVIVELVSLINERRDIDYPRFFTEDFRLEVPSAKVRRDGLDGARDMIQGLIGFAPGVRIEIRDMFEIADRLAVRWQVTSDGEPIVAMIGLYQFVDGRIAKDWGISTRTPWQDE